MGKIAWTIWLQATRPFSFSASVTPVFLGAAIVFVRGCPARWIFFPLIVVCSVLMHAGVNAISDYFDFKKGVDKTYTYGSSRVLVENLLPPRTVLVFGLSLLAGGVLLAVPILLTWGMPLVWVVIVGLVGGLFYTSEPIGYKYVGLGDFFVFFLMGPCMVIGAHIALVGWADVVVLAISLPVGFLVTAILSANNLRDISHDRQARIVTLENRIGFNASQRLNIFWIVSAYVSVGLMVLFRILPLWSLAVFFTVPVAKKNIRTILSAVASDPATLATMDVMNAQLHMVFGLLLIGSLIVQRLVNVLV